MDVEENFFCITKNAHEVEYSTNMIRKSDYMNKSTGILLALSMFFMGMVIGFIIAPIKKGISCGNNNTNCGSNNSVENNEK